MPRTHPSTARLIAVIITIMVLELKVPHQDGSAGLLAVLPIVLIYLLSFAFTGIYWINHQHLLHRIAFADGLILYANLGFLFCLSLLPFSTSYVLEKKIDSFAVSLYAVSMVITGFSFLLLRLAIHRSLRRSGDLESKDTAEHVKHLASLALYLLALPLAQFHPSLAMTVIALVTVVWIVPGLTARKPER